MKTPTLKQSLFLIPLGIIGSEVWVRLFGLWAVYDAIIIKFVAYIGGSAQLRLQTSYSLFSLITGVLFATIIYRFFKSSLAMSSAIFMVLFFIPLIIQSIYSNVGLSFFFSDLLFPVFVATFFVCIALTSRLRHA